jgi:arsenical-resistance protein 2
MATATTPSPWHAAYPVPKQASPTIDRQEVLELLRSSAGTGKKKYVLVDLRRNDHEVSSRAIY